MSPEVNRNKNIGESGANMQKSVFKRYLARMAWSTTPVLDWGDLNYLLLERCPPPPGPKLRQHTACELCWGPDIFLATKRPFTPASKSQ